MKRTQQSVLLAGVLALSLSQAACSYLPWKNMSGSTPAATPSVGQPVAGSAPAPAPATGSEKAAVNGTGSSSQN